MDNHWLRQEDGRYRNAGTRQTPLEHPHGEADEARRHPWSTAAPHGFGTRQDPAFPVRRRRFDAAQGRGHLRFLSLWSAPSPLAGRSHRPDPLPHPSSPSLFTPSLFTLLPLPLFSLFPSFPSSLLPFFAASLLPFFPSSLLLSFSSLLFFFPSSVPPFCPSALLPFFPSSLPSSSLGS